MFIGAVMLCADEKETEKKEKKFITFKLSLLFRPQKMSIDLNIHKTLFFYMSSLEVAGFDNISH